MHICRFIELVSHMDKITPFHQTTIHILIYEVFGFVSRSRSWVMGSGIGAWSCEKKR